MKPQDIVFGIVYIVIYLSSKPRLFVIVGFLSIILAMPLFALWVFFTAQRLVIYAAFCFLTFIVISLLSKK